MLFSIQYPRTRQSALPVRLMLLGISHLQEPVQRPDGLSLYQWFYCAGGKGEFIIDHQKIILKKGQGLLICPKIPHEYHGLTPEWTQHIFGFGGPACPDILQALRMHESGAYHFSDTDIFPKHIQNLYQLYKRDFKNKTQELSKECYSFLLDLSGCIHRIHTAVPASENETIRQIAAYLEEHYERAISLDDLAEQVQLSKEYMCTLFKRTMKQTIIQHLTCIRINHARILLGQYPEKRVLEIAKMCGFESPSYFGMIFKREMGMTPENYRNGNY